jgi:hypothetical protein
MAPIEIKVGRAGKARLGLRAAAKILVELD